jgi:hypothetical protein
MSYLFYSQCPNEVIRIFYERSFRSVEGDTQKQK